MTSSGLFGFGTTTRCTTLVDNAIETARCFIDCNHPLKDDATNIYS